MSLGRYKTAGSIVNDAAVDLGLGSTADPYANQDPLWQRLCSYLKSAGQDLAKHYAFRQLYVEAVLTKAGGAWTLPTGWTDAGSDTLQPSADFLGMVARTGWDRSNRIPFGGPLNAQYWQFRKAGTTVVIWAEVRLDPNQIRILPTPLPDRTLALEYRSGAWVRPAAQGVGNGVTLGAAGSDAPDASGDIVLFDRALAVAALKLRWRKETGMDSAEAQREFDREVEGSVEQGVEARVLNLAGVRRGPRLIDLRNVPDSGYGI